ncbi:MAG TPA: type I DNA topoisomerase, partial [Chloroflexota bacterium]|nr:type I DNA topoisomerase [Chloroflexota bacterium]
MKLKNLVVVESPTKARTLEKFLGRDFQVRASLGHVRDLPKSSLGVDVEHDFSPKYLIPLDKRKIVKDLKDLAGHAREVFIATDPDREGEAIAWHLVEAMDLAGKPVHRVEFHEITEGAIKQAIAQPRELDMDLVAAQQARRVLDRLVGYRLSPLLWRKVRRGLSAGRVQSVAVRLICDREQQIQSFKAEEYWTVGAELTKAGAKAKRDQFSAQLHQRGGKKISPKSEAEATAITTALNGATYSVEDVRTRRTSRQPAPPFTTSTLQQEAARKLGFTSRRTMAVAQQLYEGLDLGREGPVGLITYMRTDSLSIATVAQAEARDYIEQQWGKAYMPDKPRFYKTRSKGAQEAHEAVRPTASRRDPAAVKPFLSSEQFRLYKLVWDRFMASQMSAAALDQTSADIGARPAGAQASTAAEFLFRATGSVVVFDGFTVLYSEGRDEEEEREGRLPALATGDALDLLQLTPTQHFTQPPARYTEATLIKLLEELGIGRPSTYAPTLATIQDRRYVEKVQKQFKPTELGVAVNGLLVEQFPNIVDPRFTSNMEEELDDVASGERPWVPVVATFYGPFDQRLKEVGETLERVKVADEMTDQLCPECGRNLVIKLGRFGRFLACSGFPECKHTEKIQRKMGVKCPRCGSELVERRSKKGRVFYGCSAYPKCDFTVWNRPLPVPCPECGGVLTAVREGVACSACKYTGAAAPPAPDMAEADKLEREPVAGAPE